MHTAGAMGLKRVLHPVAALFLRGEAAPDSIESDVEAAAALIVDSPEGTIGGVVGEVENTAFLHGLIDDVQEGAHGQGIAAHLSVVHVVGGVGVESRAVDADDAVASRTTGEDQSIAVVADMGVAPGAEPLSGGDDRRGRNGREAIVRDPAGPAADHGAGPTVLRSGGSDEVALVFIGFGEAEVLGVAGTGGTAVTACGDQGDRRGAVENAQAAEGGSTLGLASGGDGYAGRERNAVLLSNGEGEPQKGGCEKEDGPREGAEEHKRGSAFGEHSVTNQRICVRRIRRRTQATNGLSLASVRAMPQQANTA